MKYSQVIVYCRLMFFWIIVYFFVSSTLWFSTAGVSKAPADSGDRKAGPRRSGGVQVAQNKPNTDEGWWILLSPARAIDKANPIVLLILSVMIAKAADEISQAHGDVVLMAWRASWVGLLLLFIRRRILFEGGNNVELLFDDLWRSWCGSYIIYGILIAGLNAIVRVAIGIADLRKMWLQAKLQRISEEMARHAALLEYTKEPPPAPPSVESILEGIQRDFERRLAIIERMSHLDEFEKEVIRTEAKQEFLRTIKSAMSPPKETQT